MNTVLEAYRQHVEERAALGVPPKPLDDAQTAQLVELLKNPPAGSLRKGSVLGSDCKRRSNFTTRF